MFGHSNNFFHVFPWNKGNYLSMCMFLCNSSLLLCLCLCFLLLLFFPNYHFCDSICLYCLVSLLPPALLSLSPLSGEIYCMCLHLFVQERTDSSRACWPQSFFSLLCVYSMYCMCVLSHAHKSFLASRAFRRALWRVQAEEWKVSIKLK